MKAQQACFKNISSLLGTKVINSLTEEEKEENTFVKIKVESKFSGFEVWLMTVKNVGVQWILQSLL